MSENVEDNNKEHKSGSSIDLATNSTVNSKQEMIELRIQVAQISTSLGELYKIEKGSKVNVDPSSSNEVKILHNGKEIGSGEVTRIGNIWGIRVRRIF